MKVSSIQCPLVTAPTLKEPVNSVGDKYTSIALQYGNTTLGKDKHSVLENSQKGQLTWLMIMMSGHNPQKRI